MAELVDALDSKSSSLGSVGSIPTVGTIIFSRPRLADSRGRYTFAAQLPKW